ncbi:MAG: hypothetical protein ACK53L_20920, partial [Pirellulaceae bacterium]
PSQPLLILGSSDPLQPKQAAIPTAGECSCWPYPSVRPAILPPWIVHALRGNRNNYFYRQAERRLPGEGKRLSQG